MTQNPQCAEHAASMPNAEPLALRDALLELGADAKHVRTYGRTNDEPEASFSLSDANARRRAKGEFSDPERFPVYRTGERDEIPTRLRIAVYSRDANTCQICREFLGTTTRNLDHIYPWSAYGADFSTNLRTVCEPCNQARSNFIDGTPPAEPCTWWCTDCWAEGRQRWARWTDKVGDPGWREQAPLVDPDDPDLLLAFCAFCGLRGYTTWARVI